jgi:ATP-grasp domain
MFSKKRFINCDMFLIDKPYASDFLIRTIRENKYPIVSTPVAGELISDNSLAWISEREAVMQLNENPETPLYSNSENALAWIVGHLPDSALAKHVRLFKDKAEFRELIKDLYPDFSYSTVKLEEIQHLRLEELTFPFVIKPSVGFFSIGVHVVKDMADWEIAREELNIERLRSIYPQNVLDTSTFIIEDYIEGEEFAVDCYFNNEGEVVILNILHHLFSSGADTSDRVYTTSKDIILKYIENFGGFLQTLGRKAELKNFPAHVELRVDKNGRIIPIEVNPLRFGGWCTTADLLGIAFGYNSYEYFVRGEQPDWDKIYENRSKMNYSIIVLNNNSGYSSEEFTHFNYDLLEKDFENALHVRKMDVGLYSVFGFVFAETSPGNEEELNRILVSDLKKYITTK